MRWRRAIKTKVVSTETAETIGHVEHFVIDPENRRVTGAVVGDRIVGFDDSGGIGVDALTVDSEESLRAPMSDREKRSASGELDPIGRLVLTEEGLQLGEVADIDFDPVDGTVEQILLGDDELAGRRLLGVGAHAVVVSAGSASNPSASTASASDLEDLTKAELYEMASDRDIDGRSSMSKSELVEALL